MHHYPTARPPSFVVGRVAAPAHFSVTAQRQDGTSLVEVGPRLVLAPIRVFAGSFGGATLYHDAGLVLPNEARQRERLDLKRGGSKYERRKEAQAAGVAQLVTCSSKRSSNKRPSLADLSGINSEHIARLTKETMVLQDDEDVS